jgi:hypothetical protein
MCLSCLAHFIKWNRSDPDRFMRPIINKVLDMTRRIDQAHELSLQK